jgi:hypothetical protein
MITAGVDRHEKPRIHVRDNDFETFPAGHSTVRLGFVVAVQPGLSNGTLSRCQETRREGERGEEEEYHKGHYNL